MPEAAQMELVTIAGREIRVRWKSPRFGEWLAWCYVPSDDGLHNQGAGFEARAATPEAARAALLEQVRAHLRV
jgi:hypothetical protein